MLNHFNFRHCKNVLIMNAMLHTSSYKWINHHSSFINPVLAFLLRIWWIEEIYMQINWAVVWLQAQWLFVINCAFRFFWRNSIQKHKYVIILYCTVSYARESVSFIYRNTLHLILSHCHHTHNTHNCPLHASYVWIKYVFPMSVMSVILI